MPPSSQKRPAPKEKDIMHIPDMFLTKAEREEKRRRLQPPPPVIELSKEEPIPPKEEKQTAEVKPSKPRPSPSSLFFQKVSVRKKLLYAFSFQRVPGISSIGSRRQKRVSDLPFVGLSKSFRRLPQLFYIVTTPLFISVHFHHRSPHP